MNTDDIRAALKQTYTTSELLRLLNRQGTTYIANVIKNPRRKTPHPLLAALVGRGLWSREIVDEYLKSR